MSVKIEVSKNLKELAKLFRDNGQSLYLVGGFVRNALLGFCETDTDLCGTATTEEVFSIVPKNLYSIELINKKLGTLHLTSKINGEVFEYTTFRAENYAKGGVHSPHSVQFVRDIRLDAKRRDFSANAIYYDILNNEVLDFYDGVGDVKKKVLRTVETPEFVFENDGLRMLRLVRIACELNFRIERKSLQVAKQMISNLKSISHERFGKEIGGVLFADYKYRSVDSKDAHIKGIDYLTKLNVWPYVFENLYKVNKLEKDVVKKSFANLLVQSVASNRYECFVIDFLTALKLEISPKNINLLLGVDGLNLNKKQVKKIVDVVLAFLDVKGGFANTDQKRLFIQHHINIIDDVVLLCKCENKGEDLSVLKNLMIVEQVPMTIKDLKINGEDLKQNFKELKKIKYGEILNHLLTLCCIAPELNNKKTLLSIVEKNV